MAPEPCVHCTCPGTIFCQSCCERDSDDVLQPTRWYCSPLCKAIDEPHREECPLVLSDTLFKRAEKAGEVAQALFYAFIQDTWAYDMRNVRIVRDQDGDLVTIEVIAGPGVNAGPGKESTCGRHAGGWLIKFPHTTFKSSDHEAKHAILADQNSIWAFVFMHAAIQALFEDLVDDIEKDIKEVVHFTPDNARHLVEHKGLFGVVRADREDIVYPNFDVKGDLKGIYSITLKDGTRIALDLTGAQYNLPHTPVMHWTAYLNSWVKVIKYRVPFRSHYDKHANNMVNYRCITHLTVVMEQTRYFNMLVTHSKAEIGFELKNLLEMEPEDFHSKFCLLIDQAHEYLLERPKELDEGLLIGCITDTFDLRHPNVVANALRAGMAASLRNSDLLQSLPTNISDMKLFDWENLRKLIQMHSTTVEYQEKKKAKLLLSHRCVYKMPGDWRLVFLLDTLPSSKVPDECVSENPYWK
ncbi:uncharacterized protein K460DRAFT_408560 [Cucurbitaria berberidis CBS 394.84]|uniref:MYND-type zinc finger protein samB n=1 Tax=Cucurbitaria berberidis CBS 394.84 TaxID=1168544 RepID=A0A9P4L7M6_9PLEO|nr:uncharacterized protein K460DRAFT_408560 [Cucurbitaria berberidis CBS 394.84]KAF1844268.1 hypothetical protein K460DRAFT_408560 [Cucurbitaria berberidis CBS 394.84]